MTIDDKEIRIKIEEIEKLLIPVNLRNLICFSLDSITKNIDEEIFNMANKIKKDIIIDIV